MMNWEIIQEKLIEMAINAGNEILKIYHSNEWKVQEKDDRSPLTEADKRSNDIICKALTDLDPDIPIISEENKQVPYSVRKEYEQFWLVDPLDGTKEFLKRNGEFTVNIALIKNQKPIAGIVYVPCTHELYYAFQGQGAFKKIDDEIEPIKARSFKPTDIGLRIMSSRSHLNESTIEYIQQFKDSLLIQSGSSLKFTKIAEGLADIYPRLAPTMEWDTAAAHAILNEAGGIIIDDETDEELLYNKESLKNPHFIAYGDIEEEDWVF